jgi:tRNA-2-methylthio-N6-dimethylallyladenosine synthase
MNERLQRLQGLLREQQIATQESMVGKEVSVLFEKAGREPGQMIGKSEYLHAVFAEAPIDVIGQVRKVRITASSANSLGGSLS